MSFSIRPSVARPVGALPSLPPHRSSPQPAGASLPISFPQGLTPAAARSAISSHLLVIQEFMRLSNPGALEQAERNVQASSRLGPAPQGVPSVSSQQGASSNPRFLDELSNGIGECRRFLRREDSNYMATRSLHQRMSELHEQVTSHYSSGVPSLISSRLSQLDNLMDELLSINDSAGDWSDLDSRDERSSRRNSTSSSDSDRERSPRQGSGGSGYSRLPRGEESVPLFQLDSDDSDNDSSSPLVPAEERSLQSAIEEAPAISDAFTAPAERGTSIIVADLIRLIAESEQFSSLQAPLDEAANVRVRAQIEANSSILNEFRGLSENWRLLYRSSVQRLTSLNDQLRALIPQAQPPAIQAMPAALLQVGPVSGQFSATTRLRRINEYRTAREMMSGFTAAINGNFERMEAQDRARLITAARSNIELYSDLAREDDGVQHDIEDLRACLRRVAPVPSETIQVVEAVPEAPSLEQPLQATSSRPLSAGARINRIRDCARAREVISGFISSIDGTFAGLNAEERGLLIESARQNIELYSGLAREDARLHQRIEDLRSRLPSVPQVERRPMGRIHADLDNQAALTAEMLALFGRAVEGQVLSSETSQNIAQEIQRNRDLITEARNSRLSSLTSLSDDLERLTDQLLGRLNAISNPAPDSPHVSEAVVVIPRSPD